MNFNYFSVIIGIVRVFKMVKVHEWTFHKEIGANQTATAISLHFAPVRMATIKK
jgi:hypothetical protein